MDNITVYTIKYSKRGINQYAEVRCIDNKVISKELNCRYCTIDELPSLDTASTLEEILKIIKEFSYTKEAVVYLINGEFPAYYIQQGKVKKSLETAEEKYRLFMNDLAFNFFKTELLPLLERNNWKLTTSIWGVVVCAVESADGKADNIPPNQPDYNLMVSICNKFFQEVLGTRVDVKNYPEQDYLEDEYFANFFDYINFEDLKKIKICL